MATLTFIFTWSPVRSYVKNVLSVRFVLLGFSPF